MSYLLDIKRKVNHFRLYRLGSIVVGSETTRGLSAAVFGNEKFVEVLLALEGQQGAATAQQLSKVTGIDHSMVRSVLLRQVAGGLVDALPRSGGRRSPQYYQPADADRWDAAVRLAQNLAAQPANQRG